MLVSFANHLYPTVTPIVLLRVFVTFAHPGVDPKETAVSLTQDPVLLVLKIYVDKPESSFQKLEKVTLEPATVELLLTSE